MNNEEIEEGEILNRPSLTRKSENNQKDKDVFNSKSKELEGEWILDEVGLYSKKIDLVSTGDNDNEEIEIEEEDSIDHVIRRVFRVYFQPNSAAMTTSNSHTSTICDIQEKIGDMVTTIITPTTMPWMHDSIKSSIENQNIHNLLIFSEVCLRGIGQVYFQNNPLSGFLILVGMFLQSISVATHGIAALVCANLTALVIGFDAGLVNDGLFGYNAFLVGLALATFYYPNGDLQQNHYEVPLLLATVFISSFTSILFVAIGKFLTPYKCPSLTLPFNLATLMFLSATASMQNVNMAPVRTPSLPDYLGAASDDNGVLRCTDLFAGVVRGIGQVYLADNLMSGLFVLAGIAVCSRIAALTAFAGSALGSLAAWTTGVPVTAITYGFYGFNSSLSVTAMFMFYTPSWGSSIFAILSGITTVICQQALASALQPYGLPFLTLPFCVITIPFLIIQGTTNCTIAVPLASISTPEDHYRYAHILTDGFCVLKDSLAPPESTRTNGKSVSIQSKKYIKQLSECISRDTSNGFDTQESCSSLWKVITTKLISSRKRNDDDSLAIQIFDFIDVERRGEISLSDFEATLKSLGCKWTPGIEFAREAFCLEMEGSNENSADSKTLSRTQFITLARISQFLCCFRQRIATFLHTIDSNCDGYIDLEELEKARAYLGQNSEMTDDELCEFHRLVCGGEGCEDVNNNNNNTTASCSSLEIEKLCNLVTMSSLRIHLAVIDQNKKINDDMDIDSSAFSRSSRHNQILPV